MPAASMACRATLLATTHVGPPKGFANADFPGSFVLAAAEESTSITVELLQIPEVAATLPPRMSDEVRAS